MPSVEMHDSRMAQVYPRGHGLTGRAISQPSDHVVGFNDVRLLFAKQFGNVSG